MIDKRFLLGFGTAIILIGVFMSGALFVYAGDYEDCYSFIGYEGRDMIFEHCGIGNPDWVNRYSFVHSVTDLGNGWSKITLDRNFRDDRLFPQFWTEVTQVMDDYESTGFLQKFLNALEKDTGRNCGAEWNNNVGGYILVCR